MRGRLCPKGSNAFQLGTNPHRVKKVLYRAPFSATVWKSGRLEWAQERIAQLTYEAREEEGFVEERDGKVAGAHDERDVAGLGRRWITKRTT